MWSGFDTDRGRVGLKCKPSGLHLPSQKDVYGDLSLFRVFVSLLTLRLFEKNGQKTAKSDHRARIYAVNYAVYSES